MAGRWASEAEAMLTGVKEWRQAHPRATLAEIEAAVDERLARVRARLIEDVALALRGPEVRHLRTTYEHELALRRHYLRCPACGEALFPPG
jgi:hypothetical protein